MNNLSLAIHKLRASFLKSIRSFFSENDFLEVDTPSLKKIPGMEPYLDPMQVSSPHNSQEGYLITSPEYSLKQAVSLGLEKVYEISHSFRSGEKGELHSSEFLMLEFYQAGINEKELMQICIDLFYYLEINFKSFNFKKENCKIISMEELFKSILSIGFEKEELILFLNKKFNKNYEDYNYDDLFFLTFLNFIEPSFKQEFIFIYDYPKELSSLAKIQNNKACRFEIYFGRTELGNAFYELNSYEEQKNRFIEEQNKRKILGKEVFPIDFKFLESLKSLPNCSGIAIGLDRLFMTILNEKSLKNISPYYGVLN